jgi:c-di-GMP-binding flagellar brake protein YcgR
MEHNKSHPAGEYQGENEKVSHPARIASLLRRVHEERALLTITLPGSDAQYKSAVLEVNLTQDYVLLDELNPPEGHGRFLAAKKFHAHTRLKGVDISFSGKLREATQEGGMALYQVALPASIQYRQRRTSYRVQVGAGLIVPVTLEDKNLLRLSGHVCDISVGGIGLRAKAGPSQTATSGAIYSDCEIQLPDNERIRSGLELCFVSAPDQRNMLRLGGRFVGLEPADRKIVEHFVMALERELLRRRQKD